MTQYGRRSRGTCRDCGTTILSRHVRRHIRSKKHQANVPPERTLPSDVAFTRFLKTAGSYSFHGAEAILYNRARGQHLGIR